jgi:hypothetical protein
MRDPVDGIITEHLATKWQGASSQQAERLQADVPDCPRCREPMNYLMQLDGDLPTATRDGFGWGSGGLAYGFSCNACRVSAWLWQCT